MQIYVCIYIHVYTPTYIVRYVDIGLPDKDTEIDTDTGRLG